MSERFPVALVGRGALELASACAVVVGAGLVVVVGGPAPGDGPATRRARRTARALARRGLAVTAAGPAAWLAADDPGDVRVAVEAAGASALVAVPLLRDALSEELFQDCRVVCVIARAGDEVGELALEDVAGAGPVVRVDPPGALERAALRTGLPPAPARRRSLREVLGA